MVAELGKSDSRLLSVNLLTGNAYLTLVQRECLPLIPTRLPLQQQQGIQEFPKGIFKAQVFIYIIFFFTFKLVLNAGKKLEKEEILDVSQKSHSCMRDEEEKSLGSGHLMAQEPLDPWPQCRNL